MRGFQARQQQPREYARQRLKQIFGFEILDQRDLSARDRKQSRPGSMQPPRRELCNLTDARVMKPRSRPACNPTTPP